MSKLRKLFKRDPYAGSILDLVGGRTYLPSTKPVESDATARLMLRQMPRTSCLGVWAWGSDESLRNRLTRIGRAFLNIKDLMGG